MMQKVTMRITWAAIMLSQLGVNIRPASSSICLDQIAMLTNALCNQSHLFHSAMATREKGSPQQASLLAECHTWA